MTSSINPGTAAPLTADHEHEIRLRWAPIPKAERAHITVSGTAHMGTLLNALGFATTDVPALLAEIDRLRARIEELTQQRDDLLVEDALAEQQRDETVPRTERSRWVAIADALNAAAAAGMPVGIDLDGTLTDREAWSVIWDREAEKWTVAGYDDGDAERGESR